MGFKYANDASAVNRYGRFVPCQRIPIDFDAKSINQSFQPLLYTGPLLMPIRFFTDILHMQLVYSVKFSGNAFCIPSPFKTCFILCTYFVSNHHIFKYMHACRYKRISSLRFQIRFLKNVRVP